jgi:hypothetical protein
VRRHSVWDFAGKNCWQWCTGWLQYPLSVAGWGHSEGAEADEFRVDNLWSDTGDASMRKLLLGVMVLGVAVGTAWTFSGAAQKDDDDKKKPKYTIKEVMKKAHNPKDGLLKKVQSDKASKEELKELLAMYQALELNKPPKGEDAEWKKRTEALVKAANASVKNDKEAAKLLKEATNCASCHKVHKGK